MLTMATTRLNLSCQATLSPLGTVFWRNFAADRLKADHKTVSHLRLIFAVLTSLVLHLNALNWNKTDDPAIDPVAEIEKITISLYAVNLFAEGKSSSNDLRPVQASKIARADSAGADLPVSKRTQKTVHQKHRLSFTNSTKKRRKTLQSAEPINRSKPETVDRSERLGVPVNSELVHTLPEQRLLSEPEIPRKHVRLAPRSPIDALPESVIATQADKGQPRTATASSSLKQPKISLIRNPRFRRPPRPPNYPHRAVRYGQEGTATFHAKISSEGKVQQINLFRSSGFTLLDQAAITAVGKWVFEPALHNGIPIESWVEVPVNFVLEQSTRSRH